MNERGNENVLIQTADTRHTMRMMLCGHNDDNDVTTLRK